MVATFTSRVVSIEQMGRIGAAIDGTFGMLAAEGAVTTSANLTVAVAAITASSYVIAGNKITTAYAGGTVTSDAADGSNPRIDIVTIDTSGTVAIAKGTAAATPIPPTIGATKLELAMLLVASSATSFTSNDIIDRRQRIDSSFGTDFLVVQVFS